MSSKRKRTHCKQQESEFSKNSFYSNRDFILYFYLEISELWRKETQMTQTLSANKEELGKADTALRSMAGRVSETFLNS